MTETNANALPKDLGSIAEHVKGRLDFLTERHLRRLVSERRITSWKVGGKLLISASEVESLITTRPARSGES